MDVIVPFAAAAAPACMEALSRLQLPLLQQLLAVLHPLALENTEPHSLSPPHELALAQSLQLPLTDGQLPWAALRAKAANLPERPGAGWAFVSLCHWQVHNGQVVLAALPPPNLSKAEMDELLTLLQPFFATDGITLYPDQNGRWLAQGALLLDLSTAAPDRVLGRQLINWMPSGRHSPTLARLQNEIQMLLCEHPINERRAALNLPSVNSFWLNGSGSLAANYQDPANLQAIKLADHLRPHALAGQWQSWAQAWQELEQTDLKPMLLAAQAGQTVRLTLCGERARRSWVRSPPSLLGPFKRWLTRRPHQPWFAAL